jgi:hypothetical protein
MERGGDARGQGGRGTRGRGEVEESWLALVSYGAVGRSHLRGMSAHPLCPWFPASSAPFSVQVLGWGED